MKFCFPKPLATLLSCAALTLSATSLHAATSADVDLSGKVLKTGPKITASADSTPTLDPAFAYNFHFSGTVTGDGLISNVIGENVDLADALDALGFFTDSETGSVDVTVFNPGDTNNFTIFNRKIGGTKKVGSAKLKASAFAKVNLAGGVAKFSLTSPVLKVITPFGSASAGKVTFNAGSSVTVSVTPVTNSTARPDNVLLLNDNTGIGYKVINDDGTNQTIGLKQTKGVVKVYNVAIRNDGTATDNYTVTTATTGTTAAFKVAYFDGNTNVTSAVVGGTYTLPLITSGEVKVLKVKVTAKGAKGATAKIAITTTNGALTDTVAITPTVK